jgi:ketosteroid isomerase-like protein
MTATQTMLSPKEVAHEYLRRLDAGDPTIVDLFAPDATFYFPKFGIGRGRDQLLEMIGELGEHVARIEHDAKSAIVLQVGGMVVVEGVSRGVLRDGRRWAAGETPAGRYADVFDIRDGKIVRLHVYLDPDYGSDHDAAFLWGRDGRHW